MSDESTIRDDVAAAATAVAAKAPVVSPEAPAPAGPAAAAEPAAPTGTSVAPAAPATGHSPEADGSRPRNPDGTFAPVKAKAVDAKALDATPEPPPPAPAVVNSPVGLPAPVASVRAPQSWTPAAREAFGKAPPEVQAEVARREREIAAGLQEAAKDRQVASGFREALAPYAATLQGMGPDPIRAVASVVQTVHALQSAPEHVAASMLARIVQGYGTQRFGPTFIEKLAAAIDGQPVQPGAQQPVDVDAAVQRAIDQRMRSMEEAKHREAIEAFKNDPANDFYEDVRPIMAALVQGGLAKDLPEAYKQACWANPEIRAIIQQREAGQQAKANAASTQQARAAASSLKPEHGAPIGALTGSDDILADIKAAAARVR